MDIDILKFSGTNLLYFGVRKILGYFVMKTKFRKHNCLNISPSKIKLVVFLIHLINFEFYYY